MAGPIEQFEITNIFEPLPGLAVTNSALFMVAVTGSIALFMTSATAGRSLVPNRLQSLAEMSYEFVAGMVRKSAGQEGMRFLPFVFTLFMFVLVSNLFGLIPYSFTVTSHIVVTFTLAMLVIGTVLVYGFMRHGVHFLNLFVPSGLPKAIAPFVAVIEVISFLSRPISLSLRLFGNMLAGHIALKVFGGFVVSLGSLGALGFLGATLPLVMIVALMALEFLVAVLQAYVFAVLTCIYLNDAIHPGH